VWGLKKAGMEKQQSGKLIFLAKWKRNRMLVLGKRKGFRGRRRAVEMWVLVWEYRLTCTHGRKQKFSGGVNC